MGGRGGGSLGKGRMGLKSMGKGRKDRNMILEE